MIFLLDNGHGGIINGIYQTKGKRSFLLEDGRQLYEGEFNRAIVARLIELLEAERIKYVNIAPEMEDTSLKERVNRANYWTKNSSENCLYISIHANGFGDKWNSANGWGVYTSKGQTKSDLYALKFHQEILKEFPDKIMRIDWTDGDIDKEANFYVLKNTICPAILTENFFMTNKKECELLLSKEGRDRIAKAHFKAIKKINENNLNNLFN